MKGASFQSRKQLWIALFALLGIALHLVFALGVPQWRHAFGARLPNIPLFLVLAFGGVPLVYELLVKVVRREFGSDLLAGISIVASAILGEYLAGALVVLMLSGSEALEAYATRSASSVLQALAKRMPTLAHRKEGDRLVDLPLEAIVPGDLLQVFPHEICPVDGVVEEGHGSMDESYLTGEPYRVTKAPGTTTLSGAINGEMTLLIRCERPAQDSRYARIMQVMHDSEQHRPQLRRLGDQLGSLYTPLAVAIGAIAWGASGDPLRFLSVLVIATPCPLLIAIPVAIIGSISLSARLGIIIKDPAILERISSCRTAIFDKTGTLTYGKPTLTEIVVTPEYSEDHILTLVASLERYSRHPLSSAILEAAAAKGLSLKEAAEVRERPGEGLLGSIEGREAQITSRNKLAKSRPELVAQLPSVAHGLECVVLLDGEVAATLRFRDEPRADGKRFIGHLVPQHAFERVMIVSGDREEEVAYLAKKVGISLVFAGQTPEQKLKLVREETLRNPTIFLGDGINDAPALTAATVGVAFGANNEITGEAADVVILDSSLSKADALFHIGIRMRRIALESAVGGMALSVVGMLFAATGHLSPVMGAVGQEAIDVLAVLNALRAAFAPKHLSDC